MKEKEKEEKIEEIQEKDEHYLWFLIIIFLVLASPATSSKEANDRETLINRVNESDLSSSEKKRIIEILLN